MQTDEESRGGSEPSVTGTAGGAPGSPMWLPDTDTSETSPDAPATGKLATSGQDDVERGDTVSGLGSGGRRFPPSSGEQSGAPTPGNRTPEDADAG